MPSGALWSLGWQPLRHAGATFAVEQPTPTTLRLANDRDGVRAEAVIEVAAEESLETWRLRLVNETDEPRQASPRIRPRCCFRYFTFFGINITVDP